MGGALCWRRSFAGGRVGPRDRLRRAVGDWVQFRHETNLAAEAYVSGQAWREAIPPGCLRRVIPRYEFATFRPCIDRRLHLLLAFSCRLVYE